MAEPTDAPTPPPLHEPGSSGLQPNIAAVLACIFPIVGGIAFLVIEKKNAFVRFYAMQSIFWGGACCCISFVFFLFAAIFGSIPIVGLLVIMLVGIINRLIGLGFFVVYIISIIKAFTGVEWEIPFMGPLARKQLKTSPI